MHLISTSENRGIYTPSSKRLSFVTPANLTEQQHILWQETTGQSIEEWTSHFASCPFAVNMAIVANQHEKKFLVSASFSDEPEDAPSRSGFAKSSLGYISFQFDMIDRDGGLMGANASSAGARRAGFIRNMMGGIQRFNESSAHIERISSMSVGAGVYTWASYGAVPVGLEAASRKLMQQWKKMTALPTADKIAPEVGQWIDRLGVTPTAQTYRSIFVEAAGNQSVAQSMKALLLGDPRFLTDPMHRYNSHERSPIKFEDCLNDDFRFHPQDPQFQSLIKHRVAGLERN